MIRRDESIWPLLCMLACLFVLSAVAPRTWERVARSQSADEYLSQIAIAPVRSLTVIAVSRSAEVADCPTLAEIPPAVPNPESLPSKQPLEVPVLKLSVSPAPKLADDKALGLPDAHVAMGSDQGSGAMGPSDNGGLADSHFTASFAPAAEPILVGQPIRLPPVVSVIALAPAATDPKAVAEPGKAVTDVRPAVVKTRPAAAKPQPAVVQNQPVTAETSQSTSLSARRFHGMLSPAERGKVARDASGAGGEKVEVRSRLPHSVTSIPAAERLSVDAHARGKSSATAAKTMVKPQLAGTAGTPAAAQTRESVQIAIPQIVRAPRPRGKVPESLHGRLEALAYECDTGEWAMDAEQLLEKLDLAIQQASPETATILKHLGALVGATEGLASRIDDPELASQLRRTGYALSRRVALWKQAVLLAGPVLSGEPKPALDRERLGACLDRVDAMAKKAPGMGAWKTYLLCDSLRELARGEKASSEEDAVRLAQRVLDRLMGVSMDEQQQAFVNGAVIGALRMVLQRAVANSVDVHSLLERLERFEQSGSPADARLLAEDCRRLSVSPREEIRQLGEQLDGYYRNANIRVVVTQTLLNRLIPPQGPEYTEVNDTIMGVPVAGQAVNTSALGVQFMPDPSHLRLALQVSGRIHSETAANAGPATFYNSGDAEYSASKAMEIDADGIKLAPAEVAVNSRAQLRGVHTQFDGIPLIGSLAQSVARSQQEQAQGQANQETEGKISARAKQRIDAEAYAKVYDFTQKVRRRVYQPLTDLSLRPTMIGAQTSEERLAMRLRLAADDELGAFTPRPRAPADSVASLQLHESAVNNVFEKLELDGRTATLPELSRYIAGRLNRPQPWNIDPAQDDVTISFASKNAIAVRFQDGQAVLALSIARFSKGSRNWRDFQVRVCYRPQVEGRSAELVRDGTIQLSGARISGGGQIALRGVFSKAFPKNSAWKLTPQRFLNDPSLANVAVTQFVVEDGWVGVALGPTSLGQASAATENQMPVRE